MTLKYIAFVAYLADLYDYVSNSRMPRISYTPVNIKLGEWDRLDHEMEISYGKWSMFVFLGVLDGDCGILSMRI